MEEALLFAIGLLSGILSGLIPALHANFLISVISSSGLEGEALGYFIIALFPSNMLASFIPAIFFGVPEEGTVVAVLPGQRMVKEGRGLLALKVVLFSSLLSALISLALFVPALDLFPIIYGALRERMGLVLMGLSAILVLRGKRPERSLLVFLSAGLVGALALRSAMADPFLPLFSGLFALAGIAAYRPAAVPAQKDAPIDLSFLRFTLLGVALGFMADLIPGIGSPSQVAAFASLIMPIGTLGYLAAISSISVSEAVFSLATSASIGKSRMGATAMLAEAIDVPGNLLMLLVLFLLSLGLCALIIFAARRRIASLSSLDYSHMNLVLAAYLCIAALVIDGPMGLLVIGLASILGYIAIKLEVERTSLMGALILPTMLILMGL